LVAACPTPSSWRWHTRICGGGATWRSLLTTQESPLTLSPPQSHSPMLCPQSTSPRLPLARLHAPKPALESLARREVTVRRGASPGPPTIARVSGPNLQSKPTLVPQQTTFHCLSQSHKYSYPLENKTVLTPTRPFPHSVSGSHDHSLIRHVVPRSFIP
jgi:hypothetical protein